jgi:hypothetical protein
MRGRRRAAIGVAIAASAVLATQAIAGPPDNDYEGRAEKDTATYVGFNVDSSQGDKEISKIKAFLPYTCRNGNGGGLYGMAKGKLRVKPDDTFAGTLKVPTSSILARGGSESPFSDFKYRVVGKLGKKGKAKGTIDASLRYSGGSARGSASTVCYSGELDWKAKRGADLEIASPLKPRLFR